MKKYYTKTKQNGQALYYYITLEELNSTKEWRYISFLEDIELEDTFTDLVGGYIEVSDEAPVHNDTTTKRESYTSGLRVCNVIRDLTEITAEEYWSAYILENQKEFKTGTDFLNWCKNKGINSMEVLTILEEYEYDIPAPTDDEIYDL